MLSVSVGCNTVLFLYDFPIAPRPSVSHSTIHLFTPVSCVDLPTWSRFYRLCSHRKIEVTCAQTVRDWSHSAHPNSQAGAILLQHQAWDCNDWQISRQFHLRAEREAGLRLLFRYFLV
jgi:hypothetical protein